MSDSINSSIPASTMGTVGPSTALDFQGLGQLRAQAAQTNDAAKNPALRKAAEQFEALFLHQMLKTMREATSSNEDGDIMGSSTTKTYEAMFDQEIAQQMAKRGGVGLADMMVKSFERNVVPPPTDQVLDQRSRLNKDSEVGALPLVPPTPAMVIPSDASKAFGLPKGKGAMPVDLNKLVGGNRPALGR